MAILGWIGWGLSVLINLYMLVLFTRVILDWVQFFARGWRPSGIVLVLANVLYALTDPPIRWIGRFVPPLRLGGGMAIDVGFMLLFLVLIVAQRFASFLYFFVALKKGDERPHKNVRHLVMDVASVTISAIILVT